jgi:hypothetical protein
MRAGEVNETEVKRADLSWSEVKYFDVRQNEMK